ncbi:GTPase-like protein [Nannochloropsis gaditana]|uniref:GTPase-like protein n=1 Tax=Nannochloropsis gaditana TaxID=72520 RepID=W7TF44_9STRA|nr:GTPase-like protein [Nannochloropsis gaditana]
MTMEAMRASLRPGVQYVIILTKADKKDGKVSPSLKQQVADALEAHQLKETTPVLVTSAVNRLGRDEVWRYLRLAVTKPEENR